MIMDLKISMQFMYTHKKKLLPPLKVASEVHVHTKKKYMFCAV